MRIAIITLTLLCGAVTAAGAVANTAAPQSRPAESFNASADLGAAGATALEPAPEAWQASVDRRLAQQETLMDKAFGWRLGLLVGLIGLCGGGLVYLWLTLARYAAKVERVARLSAVPATNRVEKPVSTATVEDSRDRAYPYKDAPRFAARPTLPRIRFVADVIARLAEGFRRSREQRGDVETGFALVGRVVGQGRDRTILVNGLIDEGPDAARSCGHHRSDRPYQQRELEYLQLVDSGAMHVGDAHLHPGAMDSCSGGDYATDLANVRASHSQEMVFVIATNAVATWGRRLSESLIRGGIKLDFFYLGTASDYEYCRFQPDIVEGQALRIPAELLRLAKLAPVRTRLDLENLQRLTDYEMNVSEMAIGEDAEPRPCIQMRHKTQGFTTLITFGGDPQGRPEVYVENGGEVLRYEANYLAGDWARVIWFTPIVMDVEREMAARRRQVAGTATTHSAATETRPAYADAKCPGPQGAGNHELSAIEQGTRRGNPPGHEPGEGRWPGCVVQ